MQLLLQEEQHPQPTGLQPTANSLQRCNAFQQPCKTYYAVVQRSLSAENNPFEECEVFALRYAPTRRKQQNFCWCLIVRQSQLSAVYLYLAAFHASRLSTVYFFKQFLSIQVLSGDSGSQTYYLVNRNTTVSSIEFLPSSL